jgi:hypothetical protein
MEKININEIIISLVIIVTMAIILFFVLDNIGGIESFKLACESYDGRFYELQNVSCAAGHENCRYMCSLNGELYNMAELGGAYFQSYSKYFCVKDCEYENKLAKGVVCVC